MEGVVTPGVGHWANNTQPGVLIEEVVADHQGCDATNGVAKAPPPPQVVAQYPQRILVLNHSVR